LLIGNGGNGGNSVFNDTPGIGGTAGLLFGRSGTNGSTEPKLPVRKIC
jgi:hypothetical protein